MAAASIQIVQSGVAGAAGQSRDDLVTGQPVTLRNANDAGVVSWRWVMVSRPRGSAATLSNVVAAQPTFTPDVEGTYLIELSVNEGRAGEKARSLAAVRNATVGGIDTRYFASAEDAEANWLTDFGGGPVVNTTGWWDDMDRWLRLIYAVASTPPAMGDWANVLSGGNTSGASDAIMEGEQRLLSGWQATSEASGISWRTSRRYINLDTGSGTWVQMGSLLLGDVALTQSRLAIVKATAIEAGSRSNTYSVLEEVWDVGAQTRVATITSLGSIFRFNSPNQYELAVEVEEHSGLGSTIAFVTVDVTHLRYVPS